MRLDECLSTQSINIVHEIQPTIHSQSVIKSSSAVYASSISLKLRKITIIQSGRVVNYDIMGEGRYHY